MKTFFMIAKVDCIIQSVSPLIMDKCPTSIHEVIDEIVDDLLDIEEVEIDNIGDVNDLELIVRSALLPEKFNGDRADFTYENITYIVNVITITRW